MSGLRMTKTEALKLCRERIEAGDALSAKQGRFLLSYIDELQARLDALEGFPEGSPAPNPS